ncbi:condensation domain-containing protein [Streptomyces sp. NPDC006259]|uniref:condensation domain-containing protein n=1 Tax=Streptomyces sp. NPDC006259 TaxID=3364740 RepID=UPI003685ACF2
MRWSEKLAALSAADRGRLGRLVESEGSALNLFPLSYTQEWVWWNSRLQPASAMYHVGATLRLDGPLDAEVLDRVLREIVVRHEILRSSFHVLGRAAVQVAEEPQQSGIVVVCDLRDLPEAAQDAEVARLVAEDRQRPFVLTEGRLLRALLLRLDDDRAVLALTTHQLVFDDWSIGVLVREVGALYPAFAAGEPSPLPPLPVQYADFSLWQRRWMDEARMEDEFAYWEKKLRELPALLDLPADLPRPATRSFRGTLHDLNLDEACTQRLRGLCRGSGVTTYMALTAVFHLLLARATGQQEFATATLTAYRTRPEVEHVIGDFGNMLSVPVAGHGPGTTFRELLLSTRDAVLEAQEHADMPAHRITGRLRPRREESHNPLTQAMFLSVQAVNTVAGAELGELSVGFARIGETHVHSPFDVEARLVEKPGTVTVQFVVSRDLFTPEGAARLVAQFEQLLTAVLAQPDAALDAPAADAESGFRAGPDPAEGVYEAVRRHARERPRHTAVAGADGPVGYGELWQRVLEEEAADRSAGAGALAAPASVGGSGTGAVVRLLAALGGGRAVEAGDGRALEPAVLAEILRLWADRCAVGADDRCLAPAAAGTATALIEVLLPLYAGATLVPAAPGEVLGAPHGDFAVLPADEAARLAPAAAARLRTLVVTGGHGRLPGALTAPDAPAVLRAVGPAGLALWPFRAGADEGRGPSLVPDATGPELRITDARGRRVLPGAVGELRLAGASVPGGELATGLLARESAAGGVELLGRAEEPRTTASGYRVRPAEVGWALTALAGVTGAEVDFDADGALVAHVTVADDGSGTAPDADGLTARLRTVLPGYLRPARILVGTATPPEPHPHD